MKNLLSENSILKLIVLLPLVSIILASVILTNIFISTETKNYEKEIETLKQEHISNIKSIIKDRVERAIHILQTKIDFNEHTIKEEMRNLVLMGYSIIDSIHDEYGKQGKEKVQDEIKHSLRNIRFYNNKSGYFFVYYLDGTNILLPPKPSLEGKNLLHLRDPKGKPIVGNAIDLLKEKPEIFDTWYWWKKDGKELVEKLGFYKLHKELNLFIGTGKYFDDIYQEHLQSSFSLLQSITYKGGDYLFAVDEKGTVVVHKNPEILNRTFDQLPTVEQSIAKQMLAKGKEGAFIEYTPTTQKNRYFPSKKISYIKYIPELKITLGTGMYTDELNQILSNKEAELRKLRSETIDQIVFSSVIVTFILIVLMLLIANVLKRILNDYSKRLSINNQELKSLNSSLEVRVKQEVKKNQEQNEILYQQSKMAAMGEMIGNIAHQWRQPLSAISTAASGIKFQDKIEKLDKKLMHEGLDTIVRNTQTLSQTIDDFRDFFKTDKTTNHFTIQHCYERVLSLISANLKNKNIILVEEIADIKITSIENELVQVLLNLLNNARDALIDLKMQERYIFIKAFEKKGEVIIQIQDNAHGIDPKILDKIYEPYFTTKHQSQGTGIGLYMTQQIVQSSLGGKIRIKNSTFTYENEKFTGALCELRLPKSLD